jgi:hypothetical protein
VARDSVHETPRSVRRLSRVLVLLAAVAVILFLTTNALDAWLPNIATSAVTIALTVTVVERLLRREAHARLLPQLIGAYDEVDTLLPVTRTELPKPRAQVRFLSGASKCSYGIRTVCRQFVSS